MFTFVRRLLGWIGDIDAAYWWAKWLFFVIFGSGGGVLRMIWDNDPSVVVLFFVIFGAAALRIWRILAKEGRERKAAAAANEIAAGRTDWDQDWHDHRIDRQEFWRLAHEAYKKYIYWSGHEIPPLDQVLSQVEIPSDLPLPDGSRFLSWCRDFHDRCQLVLSQHKGQFPPKTYQALMNTIATGVYPEDPTFRSADMLDTGDLNKLRAHRMELSKFWDHWGRQEPIEELIRTQKMSATIQSAAAELKLLVFFEIANARMVKTGAAGKSGLFRLAKRNLEIGG